MSYHIWVAYFGDLSDPGRSRVHELADEAQRVFRTQVVNPKWVQSMQRHGYKDAFEEVCPLHLPLECITSLLTIPGIGRHPL